MGLVKTELSEKKVLTPGDYVEGIQKRIKFHPKARVETPYGYMSPAEIIRRTARPPQDSLTPGSWSG